MNRIPMVLLALILSVLLIACGKTEKMAEEPQATASEAVNPYAVQVKVMEKARDIQAESQKKVADQAARAAELEQQAGQQ